MWIWHDTWAGYGANAFHVLLLLAMKGPVMWGGYIVGLPVGLGCIHKTYVLPRIPNPLFCRSLPEQPLTIVFLRDLNNQIGQQSTTVSLGLVLICLQLESY